MANIIGLSPELKKAGQKWLAEHPVVEMTQVAELTLEGPGGELVSVDKLRCLKCGFDTPPPIGNPMAGGANAWPASVSTALKFRHGWDMKNRETYCGGAFIVITSPVSGLLPVG